MALHDQLGPGDAPEPTICAAIIRQAPADENDELKIEVPGRAEGMLERVLRWNARARLPAEGDEALVLFADDGEPWVVSYWSAAGNLPEGG